MSFANFLKAAIERDLKGSPEEFLEIRTKIERAWDYDTSFLDYDNYLAIKGKESWDFGINYDGKDEATSQCGTTAIWIYRNYGGKLMQGIVEGDPHYFNIIDNQIVDLTWRQFTAGTEITDIKEITEETILANDWFKGRYKNLENKLK